MQEFDYSNETSNDLYDVVDGLSYEEAVSAKASIEKIKEENLLLFPDAALKLIRMRVAV